ncbi:hypothetical protein H0H93_014799 [Arthromyces matolae]|nr:hypothetical protein H0H93_014799 [Arthromyces matolae]
MKPWALFQIVAMSLLSINTVVNAVPVPATANSILPSIGSLPSLSTRSLFFNPDVGLEVRDGGPIVGSPPKAKSEGEARMEAEMRRMIQEAPQHPDEVLAALSCYINHPDGVIPRMNLLNLHKLHETDMEVATLRQVVYGKLKFVLWGCKELVAMNNVEERIRVEAQRVITGILALDGFEAFEKESSPALGSSA